MEKIFLQALRKEKTTRAPFWLMRQAGRYLPEYRKIRETHPDFLKFCFTPKDAAEVTLQPIHRFKMDAAILFSDILVIPHAMGMKVWFEKGEGPKLEPITSAEKLSRLDVGKVNEALSPVYETIERVKEKLPDETALIGFAGGPWTVACYMVEGGSSKEFSAARGWAYADEKGFSQLIEKITDATITYLFSQANTGAEAIQIFDSWSGVLPADQFEKWVIAPTKKIISALKKSFPSLPIIGFPRAAGANIIPYVEHTGVDAVGVDTQMPLVWAKENLSGAVLQGNLDPVLLASDLKETEKHVREILNAMRGTPFIFNLGHGVLPHTPPEHVARLAEIVRGNG